MNRIPLLTLCVITMTFPMICIGQTAVPVSLYPDSGPQISVTGSGSMEVQADMAGVSLGVFVVDRDLPKAKSSSDSIVKRLLQLANTLNIKENDLSSSGLNIEPQYSEDVKREFMGYEVSRSVNITLRDLSLLDKLIDQAIQLGANRDFKIDLRSSRERELREQALSIAIEDAKTQASKLAAGFGVHLGPARMIRPGGSQATTSYSVSAVSYGAGTFKPGTLRFASEISVSFVLIQPK